MLLDVISLFVWDILFLSERTKCTKVFFFLRVSCCSIHLQRSESCLMFYHGYTARSMMQNRADFFFLPMKPLHWIKYNPLANEKDFCQHSAYKEVKICTQRSFNCHQNSLSRWNATQYILQLLCRYKQEKKNILIKSTLNQHLIAVLIELLPTFLIFLVHFLNIADSVWIDNDQ